MRGNACRAAVLAGVLLIGAEPAAACTFCGGGPAGRLTLREHHRAARVVIRGKLKNPRAAADGPGGTTELHVEQVLKADHAVGPGRVLVLPRYYPSVGAAAPDYLLFCALSDGRPDPTHGVPATTAVADYVGRAGALPDDPARRLGFFFAHLEAADPTVSADAFLEFAKASDADLVAAKGALDPAKLRKLLFDPTAPADRLGVYAVMLGLSGGPADGAALAKLVAGPGPLPERVGSNLGGFLAGYALLDPPAGWAALEAILADGRRPFPERLAAVGTVRFFQSTRPAETRTAVLRCELALLRQGELADLAIDDLRRWGWWDLTADVLARFDAPSAPPIVRRGVVRYALRCPDANARRFLVAVRQRDPALVARVEESLRLAEK